MAKKSGGKKAKEPAAKPKAASTMQAIASKVRQAGPAKAASAKTPDAAGQPAADQPKLEISASRNFVGWLREQKSSLAFTTYQGSKIFLIGLQADDRLSIYERTFERCMGLWATADSLYVSSVFQIWRFQNALQPGQSHGDFDRLYIPQVAWTTGDLDVHDLGVDRNGRLVFVNTLFSCLATVSDAHSFIPLWKPSFISRLAAEDRCHLNGLAMDNGLPRYVTAVAATDAADGWRDHRGDGGVVIDVQADKVVAQGLSMPHSPRLYRGRLWLLDSGTGHFGWVDPASGKFEPVAFCPGYLRGLAFSGKYALVGLSKPREKTFSGLALDATLAAKKAEPQCGLMVIDLDSGDAVHWIKISGIISELYDVAMLPGVRRPAALGLKADDIKRTVTIGDFGALVTDPVSGSA